MLTPAQNRWQMALVTSHQAKTWLYRDTLETHPADHYFDGKEDHFDIPAPKVPGMCCLGVGVYAQAKDDYERAAWRRDEHRLWFRGVPSFWDQAILGLDIEPRDDLAIINDAGVPHRVIREMLIDAWLTGDWSEIHQRAELERNPHDPGKVMS